jgi:hypothetical protein
MSLEIQNHFLQLIESETVENLCENGANDNTSDSKIEINLTALGAIYILTQ